MTLLKKMWQNKIFMVLLILTVVLLPSSFYQQETNKIRAVATTIGIDLVDGGVGVSVLHIIPKESGNFNQNTEIAYAEGENVSEAISKIALNLGKHISLSHCDSIILSKNLAEKGMIEYVDFLVRRTNLTTNAVMVVCENSKEMLQTIKTSKILTSMSVRELIEYNNRYLFSGQMSIEGLYKTFFSEGKIDFIPYVELSDQNTAKPKGESGGNDNEKSGGAQQSSNAKNSANSSNTGGVPSQENNSEQDILNDGKTFIIKNGKLIEELDKDIILFFNLIDFSIKQTIVVGDEYRNEDGDVQKITIETYSKEIKRVCKFVNGVPVVHYNLNLLVNVNELTSNKYHLDDMNKTYPNLDEHAMNSLISKIDDCFTKAVNKVKTNNYDLFKVENFFDKVYHNQWKEYSKNNENLFENMIFSFDININKR